MHRLFLLFLILFLPLSRMGAWAETHEEILKSRESWTTAVTLGGRQFLLYAQNSPEWKKLYMLENAKGNRRFGEAGCAVTALANATVNAIPMHRLREITGIMPSPLVFDSVVLARYFGRTEGRFYPAEDCDFVRYWPLILANYAEGNNVRHSHEAQGPSFYAGIFEHFGLTYTITADLQETIDAVRNGALAVSCSSGKTSPFSRIGHFFTICAVDDEAVYILDSYFREAYPKDTRRVLQILAPGVLRVSLRDLNRLGIQSQYVIWPAEDATVYTPETWLAIVDESNALIRKNGEQPDATD